MAVFKRWNGTSWEVIGPTISNSRVNTVEELIAPEYDSNSPYSVGDFVVYSDTLYKCNTAIGSGGELWNSAHWTETKIGDEVSDLKSALSNFVTPINVSLVNDEYISTAGTIISYNGWSRTDYIDCSNQTKFYVITDKATPYTHFYDANKNPVGARFLINIGTTEVTVDSRAKYFIISNDTSTMNKLIVKYSLTDKTLSIDGKAADAKTVGNELAERDAEIERLDNEVSIIDNGFVKIPVFTDITSTIEWNMGAYWWDGSATPYASMGWALVGDVLKNDVFKIKARALGGVNALILADNNGNTIATFGPGSGYLSDEIFVMPSNGKLYTNTESQYLVESLYRLYKAESFDFKTITSLTNVKWTTIGDSLNDFAVLSNNWIRDMVNATGANITNLAASGTGFYRTSDYDTPSNYATKISLIPQDTELITIAGSFNDLMSSPTPNIPVGTATDTGTSTIAGWMNAFFDALLTAFPHTPVGVYMTSPWDRYHYGSTQSDAYVAVLKEICLIRGIPFNDDCYYGSLRPWDADHRAYYYTKENGTVDGVHPNAEGHKIIYQRLKKFIESLPCNT